jgi:hypothetical protein
LLRKTAFAAATFFQGGVVHCLVRRLAAITGSTVAHEFTGQARAFIARIETAAMLNRTGPSVAIRAAQGALEVAQEAAGCGTL